MPRVPRKCCPFMLRHTFEPGRGPVCCSCTGGRWRRGVVTTETAATALLDSSDYNTETDRRRRRPQPRPPGRAPAFRPPPAPRGPGGGQTVTRFTKMSNLYKSVARSEERHQSNIHRQHHTNHKHEGKQACECCHGAAHEEVSETQNKQLEL